jgi:ABC-type nitrate/sulfonate/bicarbonate transport system substrate-binding protein
MTSRFPRKTLRLSALLLTTALLLSASLPARTRAAARPEASHAPATLRVGVFSRSLPMLAAQSKGFFARENLTVSFLQVQSSTQQFTFLRDGQYDIVQTALDNVVNYRLNNSNPLGPRFDAQMFMGMDLGTGLSVVARPGIYTVEDLRGKVLSVDAPDSGFAYVLYKILRAHGLERGRDYQIVQTGGVAARFQGLLAGNFDATLLSSGFEIRATNAGFNLLESVTAVANPYLSSVSAARQSWMERNRDVLVRFIRACYDGTRWSADPANREEAVALLMTQPNTSRALAEQFYEEQLNEETGLITDLSLDRLGMLNVLELREEFGGFDEPQNLRRLTTPASGLYDLSYRRAALHDERREGEEDK